LFGTDPIQFQEIFSVKILIVNPTNTKSNPITISIFVQIKIRKSQKNVLGTILFTPNPYEAGLFLELQKGQGPLCTVSSPKKRDPHWG